MKRFCVFLLLAGCDAFLNVEDTRFGGGLPRPPTPTKPKTTNFGPVEEVSPAPLPISGGTTFISRDGETAIVADPDRDVVWLVDLDNLSVSHTIDLYPGDEPGRGVEDADGRAHLVLRNAGAVVSFRISTGEILARRSVCNTPRGIAFDPKTNDLYVACQSGKLITLPVGVGNATASIDLLPDLRDVVVTEDGIYISRFRSAEIIFLKDGLYERRTLPGSESFSPTVAWRMVRFRDGVAVLHQLSGTTELRNNPVSNVPEYYGTTANPLCPVLVQSVITLMLPDSVHSLPPLEAVLSVDIAFDDARPSFAVASPGNAGTSPGSALFVDTGFFGACLAPIRTTPSIDSEAISVAVTPAGQVVTQFRAPPTLMVGEQAVVLEDESAEERAHYGHAVFHRNSGAAIACASCHPEGGEDGHTWNFTGVGLRRTQSLRAAVADSAPFHWSGELPDLPSLIDEVFTRRMRGPILANPGRQIMMRWLGSIRPYTRERPESSDAVERGRALFEDPTIGCANCHAGAHKTNNLSANVGTGEVLQVPSLIGVSSRLPLMHDGCAETLLERFSVEECGGGDRHGLTSILSDDELSDLTAYLKTL